MHPFNEGNKKAQEEEISYVSILPKNNEKDDLLDSNWIAINNTDPPLNDTPKFNDTKSKEINLQE